MFPDRSGLSPLNFFSALLWYTRLGIDKKSSAFIHVLMAY